MLHSLTNMSLRVPVVLAAFVIFVPTLEASTGGRFSFASLAKGHQHDATRTEAWIETWPSSRTKTVAPLPLQDKKKQVGAISQRTLASSMSFLVGTFPLFELKHFVFFLAADVSHIMALSLKSKEWRMYSYFARVLPQPT